ncbi:MAG: hypothetical protein C4345_03535 [Chloroflexota bacterium]
MLVPALLVALVTLVPVLYLVLRASEAGIDIWHLLWRERTAYVLKNTVMLAAGVSLAASAIAVPMAWLTTRSDLPGRRFWATIAPLPLVIPSYVGALTIVAALGPRGFLQSALERPFGIERLPEIYGFWGAWLTLTVFTYPYVLLSVRARSIAR